jgi:TonB family protein
MRMHPAPQGPRPPRARAGLAWCPGLLAALALVMGCGRTGTPPHGEGRSEAPRALPLAVYADTGRTTTLRVEPPSSGAGMASGARASAWLTRVSPARVEPAALPSAEPEVEPIADSLLPSPPPALVVDEHLRPPLPRTRAPLAVPPGARGSVELDVRVNELGEVSEIRWAEGTRDPALVRAATDCARAMRFFPAERAGRPVAVWCRQRFDFGVGGR